MVMNDEILIVNTIKGQIRAIATEDSDYPAIKIYNDGILIATIECINEDGQIRTISYNKKSDEPIAITNF